MPGVWSEPSGAVLPDGNDPAACRLGFVFSHNDMPISQPDVVPSEPLNLCTAQPGERPQHDARQKLIGCSGEKLTHFAGCEDLDGKFVRFDCLRGFDGMTVKAALARAVAGDAVGPVARGHFAAVDFDCGASDFDESRPRSTFGGFVFFHVNCVICVARIAP